MPSGEQEAAVSREQTRFAEGLAACVEEGAAARTRTEAGRKLLLNCSTKRMLALQVRNVERLAVRRPRVTPPQWLPDNFYGFRCHMVLTTAFRQ